MTSASTSIPDRERTRTLLRWVAIAAAVDFLLLLPLLYASFTDSELVSVLGPLHGIGFLIQLFLTVRGAGERLWGWWFPVIVVITLGPPGALIGHIKVSRDLR